jgi:hypothetical protein
VVGRGMSIACSRLALTGLLCPGLLYENVCVCCAEQVMVACLPFLAGAAVLLSKVTTTLGNKAQEAYTEVSRWSDGPRQVCCCCKPRGDIVHILWSDGAACARGCGCNTWTPPHWAALLLIASPRRGPL